MDPDYEQYVTVPPSSHCPSNTEGEAEKISTILKKHISAEIDDLESDICETDKRLNETQLILDRLRAAMLISYYKRAENSSQTASFQSSQQGIHPAIKTEIGKSIPSAERQEHFKPAEKQEHDVKPAHKNHPHSEPNIKHGKSQHRVIVGNVSKYIPVHMRQRNDQSTHKWMVYVRGPREHPDISHFVEKVWFFLHPTYKPNDLVEVTSPPFHLTRRGWGEFPVRVQLYLKDGKGRKADIIHHLKLDRTYTGEQNLGSETHVDVEVEPPNLGLLDGEQLQGSLTNKVHKVSKDNNIQCNSLLQDTTIAHPSPTKRSLLRDLTSAQTITKLSPQTTDSIIDPQKSSSKRLNENDISYDQTPPCKVKTEPGSMDLRQNPSNHSISVLAKPNGIILNASHEQNANKNLKKGTSLNNDASVSSAICTRKVNQSSYQAVDIPKEIVTTNDALKKCHVNDKTLKVAVYATVTKLRMPRGNTPQSPKVHSRNINDAQPKGVSLLRSRFTSPVNTSTAGGKTSHSLPRHLLNNLKSSQLVKTTPKVLKFSPSGTNSLSKPTTVTTPLSTHSTVITAAVSAKANQDVCVTTAGTPSSSFHLSAAGTPSSSLHLSAAGTPSSSLHLSASKPGRSLINNASVSSVLAKPLSRGDANSCISKNTSAVPIYVKCALPDGRVMLIRKQVFDQNIHKNVGNQMKLKESTSSTFNKVAADVHYNEQTSSGNIGYVRSMPSADLIPDVHTLLSKLAQLHPLLRTAEADNSTIELALPAYNTYSNWPIGKRRAWEWQRAKRIQRHLITYIKFTDVKAWTTKNVLIWCRQHLYTPICPEDRLLCLPKSLMAAQEEPFLKVIAKQVLSEGRSSGSAAAEQLSCAEEDVDVTADAASSTKIKTESTAGTVRVSLLEKESDMFITGLMSELGLKLGYTEVTDDLSANVTTSVIHTLYNQFMEDLIRRSHATMTSGDNSELLPQHIHSAIKGNQQFEFLDEVFIDEHL